MTRHTIFRALLKGIPGSLILALNSSLAPAQYNKDLKFIEGGTFIMGGGFQYEVRGHYMILTGNDSAYTQMNNGGIAIGEIPDWNNPEHKVTVASFYMSDHEVTNDEYWQFLEDSLLNEAERKVLYPPKYEHEAGEAMRRTVINRAIESGLMPDTACWETDFPLFYCGPLSQNYFQFPAFFHYPVTGVSWEQANAFCEWITRAINRERAKKGKDPLPAFRLPTEAEWEYAARGIPPEPGDDQAQIRRVFYPYPGTDLRSGEKWLANIKTSTGNYIEDNFEYTAPVKTFPANGFGLYDMAGNVAEWTMDEYQIQLTTAPAPSPPMGKGVQLYSKGSEGAVVPPNMRVVKGGSWADYKYAALCGSRTPQAQDHGSSRTGFRLAMSVTDEKK